MAITKKSNAHTGINAIVGIATLGMSALAAGALWCVIAVVLDRELSWLALPIGMAIAQISRMNDIDERWWGAPLAAALTLVACAYAEYLLAAVHTSKLLGIQFKNALINIGPGMAYALARAKLGLVDWLLLSTGALLAALWTLLGHRQSRRQPAPALQRPPETPG